MQIIKILVSIIFIVLISDDISSQNKYPLSNQINQSTVKIDLIENGKHIGSASGFIIGFIVSDSLKVPCLISNKHVLQAVDTVILTFNGEINTNSPMDSVIIRTIVDLNHYKVIPHPKVEIDLAALPLNPIGYQLGKKGFNIDYTVIGEDLIPTVKDQEKFKVVNDILLVGYPIGLSDTTHNNPIFRKGITATNPSIKYNDRNVFLIDASSFPGSSGSPVFLVSSEIERKSNMIYFKERIYLIGILFGGLEYTIQGDVKAVQIPNNFELKSLTNIPINLGVVINAKELFQIKNVISTMIEND